MLFLEHKAEVNILDLKNSEIQRKIEHCIKISVGSFSGMVQWFFFSWLSLLSLHLMVEWIIQLANITVSSTNTMHSSTMSLWGYSSPYWGNRNWHWRRAAQSPQKVDCGKVQTFCINFIWKYIKPVILNIPHIEVYTLTVATHLCKIKNSWQLTRRGKFLVSLLTVQCQR